MQYLKFDLVFDLNIFHKLNLYQVNIAELTFSVFFLFPVFAAFVNFGEITT